VGATWKNKLSKVKDKEEVQRSIASARDKRRPAAFFAVVRKDETDPEGRLTV